MSDEKRDPTILPVTEVMVRFDMREGREWNKQELKLLVRELETDYGKARRDMAPGKVILLDEAEQEIAQLGESLFAVHRMRPYTGWSDLSARAERMLELMEGLRSSVRSDVRKVWVGCNVELMIRREGPFELSEYLKNHKDWPTGKKHEKSTMICEKNEAFWFEHPEMGAQHRSSLRPNNDQLGSFILDVNINVFKIVDEPTLDNEVLNIAEDRMREIFEETFTDGALNTLQNELREEIK
jgi:hypothetical protein